MTVSDGGAVGHIPISDGAEQEDLKSLKVRVSLESRCRILGMQTDYLKAGQCDLRIYVHVAMKEQSIMNSTFE